MAEGLAQKWLENHGCVGWLAVSAGVCTVEGMPTSRETVESLAQHDISFDGRSTPLTKKMAEGAQLVLCMSKTHLSIVNQHTSHAELLNPKGDIDDPIGQGQSEYDALALQMEPLIAQRLELLTHEGV